MNILIEVGAIVCGGSAFLLVVCPYPRYRDFKKWENDRNGTFVCQSERDYIRGDIRLITGFVALGVAMIMAGSFADTLAMYWCATVSLLAFAVVSIFGYWISIRVDRELKQRVPAFTI